MKFKNMIAVFLLALLVGCFGTSPSSTAKSFMNALQDGNVTEAKKYATDGAGGVLDMMAAMGNIPNVRDFKIVKEEIDGNRAVVYYTEGGSSQEQTLELVKIEGKWKVQLSK